MPPLPPPPPRPALRPLLAGYRRSRPSAMSWPWVHRRMGITRHGSSTASRDRFYGYREMSDGVIRLAPWSTSVRVLTVQGTDETSTKAHQEYDGNTKVVQQKHDGGITEARHRHHGNTTGTQQKHDRSTMEARQKHVSRDVHIPGPRSTHGRRRWTTRNSAPRMTVRSL